MILLLLVWGWIFVGEEIVGWEGRGGVFMLFSGGGVGIVFYWYVFFYFYCLIFVSIFLFYKILKFGIDVIVDFFLVFVFFFSGFF